MVRRLLVAVVVVVVAGVAPAGASTQVRTTGVRYRDDIFSAVKTTTDITYGTAVDQTATLVTLKLDLHTPKGDTVTSRPAIVWVHGGGFSGGDKTSPELLDESDQFARKGYVNVSINYRLAPVGCVGAITESCLVGIVQAMQDAQTAVRFLRSRATKYGIDPTRIAIGGSSAGAITALNVGYNAADPGPGDHQGFSSAAEAVQSLSGAAIGTTPGADGAPALLFHGTADPLVPYAWAQATVQSAKAAGLVAKLVTWPGDGHVPYLAHRAQILDKTRDFFYLHLDLVHASS
ncbi:MAG TPA: alpha/beta hydrolase [Acidimicrobiia bacterium]